MYIYIYYLYYIIYIYCLYIYICHQCVCAHYPYRNSSIYYHTTSRGPRPESPPQRRERSPLDQRGDFRKHWDLTKTKMGIVEFPIENGDFL